MSTLLNRVLTSNTYTPVCAVSPAGFVKRISWSEGGTGDFYAQFWVPIAGQPGKFTLEPEERYYARTTAGAFATGVSGVQFRSATPGQSATITCDVAYTTDPEVYSGAPTSTTTVTGGVNVQHNGVLVGTEPTVDFEDGAIGWSVTNDGAGSRVKVSGGIDVMSLSLNSPPQSIASGVLTQPTFAAAYDFNTSAAVYPARGGPTNAITVSEAGYYEFTGWGEFATGAGAQRLVGFFQQGVGNLPFGLTRVAPNTGDPDDLLAQVIVAMTAGQYVAMNVFQDSGGNLDLLNATVQARYLHS